MEMNEINRTAKTKARLFSALYALSAYSAFIINNSYSWQIPEIIPRSAFPLHLPALVLSKRHSPECVSVPHAGCMRMERCVDG